MNTAKILLNTALIGGVVAYSAFGTVLAIVEPSDTPTVTATAAPTPAPTRATVATKTVGQIRAAALAKAKEVATNIFNNQFLKRFNTVRTNVSNNTKLGADAKTAMLTKLDNEIAWFTTQRDSLNSATTIEQVKTTTKNARTRFHEAAKEVRRLHIAGGYVVSLEKVITNTETNIFPKVQNFLEQLTAKGIDVASEQALFDQAKEKIALSKAELPTIRNSTTYEDAKSHFDKAKAYMKEARELLKQLTQSLKAKVPTTTPTGTVTVTVTPTT
jgi:hypothetical protein